MDKPKQNTIEYLTDCLAVITYRAMEAERKLAETLESSEMWYHRFKEKSEQLEEANKEITALIETLAEAEKKGAQDNE